ncbi:MAG TPA: uracil-DNA glycosylase, partial [Chlamydiales bacterium]|nr:uracil-DNA glycosylase [Chlamydiales bacterium]
MKLKIKNLKIEESWDAILEEEYEKLYFVELAEFVKQEREAGKKIFPPKGLVFHALQKTPYDKVNVVIVGQDPYHGEGQAHGLSFSVPQGIKPPPSLQNIFKELHQDLGLPIPNHGCLEKWAEQGVLLLNATLTVAESSPMSHHK